MMCMHRKDKLRASGGQAAQRPRQKPRPTPPHTHLLPVLVLPAEEDLLAEDAEVRLVRGQPQHDQVGVQPVQDMPRVRLVPAPRTNGKDSGHELTAVDRIFHPLTDSGPSRLLGADRLYPIRGNSGSGTHPGWARSLLTKSMILCSPSPGSLPSEKMTWMAFQAGTVLMRCAT
jgi:hypothetical protein